MLIPYQYNKMAAGAVGLIRTGPFTGHVVFSHFCRTAAVIRAE